MVQRIFSKIIILFLLIFSQYALSQEHESPAVVKPSQHNDSLVTKNPTGAMLRSLCVPGWGQLYNGKWFKAIIIAGAEIGLIANAIVLNKYAKEATDHEEYLFYIENRNFSYWLLSGTILYSMTDAYVDAHLYNFDESTDLSLQYKNRSEPLVNIKSPMLLFQLSYKF